MIMVKKDQIEIVVNNLTKLTEIIVTKIIEQNELTSNMIDRNKVA